MFSVIILTLNEEQNLADCIGSASCSDDIVVLDSGSTDRTRQIATDCGARIFERKFDNFGSQRNFAHESIPFKNEWVFHLDADERLTPELAAECMRISQAPSAAEVGYYCAPKMIWRRSWLPHCTDFPAYQARFASASRFRFIQAGHGQREAENLCLGYLKGNYLHYIAESNEEDWLEKHRGYAAQEASRHLQDKSSARELLRLLFSPNALTRRRALKQLSFYLPCRGSIRFMTQYFLKGGFLDGKQAYPYCRLLACYENMIARSIRDQKARGKL